MSAFVALSPTLSRAGGGLAFRCPGCDGWHVVNVDGEDRPRWTWNGSAERPTFEPSILVRTGRAVTPAAEPWEEGDPPLICHSFVRDGRIEFCSDSTHALAGQTVALPEFEG